MKRWLIALLLACSCGPCCPCDDCECDAQQIVLDGQPSVPAAQYEFMAEQNRQRIGGLLPITAQPAQTQQQLFQWSPKAPHHAAACIVRASDGSTGSGVYMRFGQITGVLTCRHVVNGKMSATFSDGKTLSGEHRIDKDRHDIAWIAIKHPTIKPLVLAASPPRPGERVEFVSRGGPESQLRHWFGTVQSDGDRLMVNANITPGDSGGTIVNARGEVVGVSTDGQTTAAIMLASGKTIVNPDPNYARQLYESNQGWIVYGTAGSPGYGPVRRFLQRLHVQFCPDCPNGQCPPYEAPPSGSPYGDLYPPGTFEQPQQPAPYSPPASDFALGVEDLKQRIEQLEKSQQGPPGKDGRDGKDGAPGRDGKAPSADEVAAALQPSLPTAEQISDALFAKYGEEIAGKVKAQIPPLYVEVVDPTGKYSAPPQAIHFMEGEGLRLTLDPTQIVLPGAN